MTDIELQKIWRSYDQKLEEAKVLNLQSWAINVQCFEAIQSQKAKSKLKSLLAIKWVAVIFGFIWILFVGVLVSHSFSMPNIIFVICGVANILITLVAIALYIQQIIYIQQIDNSETVIEAQRKIASLRLSTLNAPRVLFLSLPLYSAFYINKEVIEHAGVFWLTIQFVCIAIFIFLAIWLYKNINFKNKDKKWFRLLFSSAEWTSITKAMDLLDEIEEFKKER